MIEYTYLEAVSEISAKKRKGIKNKNGVKNYDETINKYYEFIGTDRGGERQYERRNEQGLNT